ncbi:MAG: lipocalin-like domain-containing protein [Candidatus Hermodarchaeota archaeon]
MSTKIKETWFGPGRKDGVIKPIELKDDALHIDMEGKGTREWWYFDARLDNGYTVVGFFRAKHERTGKTGVEITIYKPNGEKIQKVIDYPHSALKASREIPDVQIGENFIKVDYSNRELPTYEIFLDEGEFGFHLKYSAKVHGWKPGEGFIEFGKTNQFGWVIALPRAEVEGTIKVNNETFQVKGLGYHDHNWLNFNFAMIIDYWYWGRIYSENFTTSFAYIKCNKRMDNYPIQVLMVAKNENVIISTGEYDLVQDNFEFNEKAGNKYPKALIFNFGNSNKLSLNVQEIIDADNLLYELGPITRFFAKNLLKLRPGYFRLNSKFHLTIHVNGESFTEKGNALHEMVIAK